MGFDDILFDNRIEEKTKTIGHVPLVERLVEGFCAFKHITHIRYVGNVPIANLAVFVPNVLLPSSTGKIVLYRIANTSIRQRRTNEFFYSSI